MPSAWTFDMAQWRSNMHILRQNWRLVQEDSLECSETIEDIDDSRKRSLEVVQPVQALPVSYVHVTSEGIVPVRGLPLPLISSEITKSTTDLLRSDFINERVTGASRIISAHECTCEVIDALIDNVRRDESGEIFRSGQRVAAHCAPKAITLAAMSLADRRKWFDKRGDGNRAALLAIERCGGMDSIMMDVVDMASTHTCMIMRRECARIVAESDEHDNVVSEWLQGGDAHRLLGALEGCPRDAFVAQRIDIATSDDLSAQFQSIFGSCSVTILKRVATPPLKAKITRTVVEELMEKMVNIVLTSTKHVKSSNRDHLASSKLLALRVVHAGMDLLHSTVITAIRRIAEDLEEDGGVRYAIRAIIPFA